MDWYMSPYSNMTIFGAGRDVTKLSMPGPRSDWTPMVYGHNLSNFTLRDLTLRTTVSWPNYVRALQSDGMQNCTVQRVRVENCDYGFKLGSGNQSSGWLFDDVITRNVGTLSLQPIDVSNSTFRNLDLQNRTDTGEGMPVYIERDNHYLTFENVKLSGGSRNNIQLYNGYDSSPSDHITFRDLVLDRSMTSLKYPLVVDYDFSDVTFTNTTIIGNPNSADPCIVWYGGIRIVFDGITASGGAALHGVGPATSSQIKNGTYTGPAIGSVSGVSVTNVVKK
jgi:hypothetical protein